MQKLIVKSDNLPPLYSQENNPDPMVRTRLFALGSGATWYLTEYSEVAPDGTERLGFGLCDLYGDGDAELGYVSIAELENLNFMGIPRVERDRYWTPKPLSVVQSSLKNGF